VRLSVKACRCTGDICQCTETDFNPRKDSTMIANVSAADIRHLTNSIADSFDSCAAACDAIGLGGHITQGHAAIARGMARHIRAEAAVGSIPHVYHRDLHAAADAAPEPATLPAETTRILSKLFI
jgi:hypothetical protein